MKSLSKSHPSNHTHLTVQNSRFRFINEKLFQLNSEQILTFISHLLNHSQLHKKYLQILALLIIQNHPLQYTLQQYQTQLSFFLRNIFLNLLNPLMVLMIIIHLKNIYNILRRVSMST